CISHFMEHMLFKGTKKRNPKKIVQAIERVGGLINASTGREVTYFYIRIAAKRLELAMDVLTDLVFNPAFVPDSVEREKGVVLEELHMNEDDPMQALYDRFMLTVYGKTAFGRPILGTEETINSFKRKTLRDFHAEYYNPSSLVASIAGGIDPDKAQNVLEKKLSGFKSSWVKTGGIPKPVKIKPLVRIFEKDVEQAALLIGFPSTNILSEDRYAFSLLDAITAGGMMSRLFQEIREKRGLVYSIDSTHQPFRRGGIFTIEAGMREENLTEVLRLTLRELSRLAKQGPGKRELEDAKLYLRGHWALGLEATASRMIRNAMATLFFGRLLAHDEVVSKLSAVTLEDVARSAQCAFENGNPAVGALSRFENGNKTSEIENHIIELKEKAFENNLK
ncbi:MAG: pitrilysin family protein, partial [bacterium]